MMTYRFHRARTIAKWLKTDLNTARQIRAAVKDDGPRITPFERLEKIDRVLGTLGVEIICAEEGYKLRNYPDERGAWLYYCNTGNAHGVTVCYDPVNGRFLISSWGDWDERSVYRERWHQKLDE